MFCLVVFMFTRLQSCSWLLLLLLLIEHFSFSLSLSPIRIGYIESTVGLFRFENYSISFRVWFDHLNKTNGINGHPIQIISRHIPATTTVDVLPFVILNVTEDIMLNENVDVFLHPPGDLATYSAYITDIYRLPSMFDISKSPALFDCRVELHTGISYIDKYCSNKASNRRFTYSHSFDIAGSYWSRPFILSLRMKKVKTIAVITDELPYFVQSALGTKQDIKTNHIKIVFEYTIPLKRSNWPMINQSIINDVIEQLIKTKPEAVILNLYEHECGSFLKNMKKMNYNTNALLSYPCLNASDAVSNAFYLSYSTFLEGWHRSLVGPMYTDPIGSPGSFYPSTHQIEKEDNEEEEEEEEDHDDESVHGQSTAASFPSAIQFHNQFKNIFHRDPTYLDAAMVSVLLVIEYGFRVTNVTRDRDVLNNAIHTMDEPSFFGHLAENKNGYNPFQEIFLLQYIGLNEPALVAPLSAASIDFVYPMPTWEERIYISVMYGHVVEKILMSLMGGLGSIFTTLMAILIYYRNNPAARASAWRLMILMGSSCYLSYIAIMLWPIENNHYTCSSRHWAITLAFHTFISPLIAKSYRIITIFRSGSNHLKEKKIRDSSVLLLGFLISLPQLLINIIWSSISSPVPYIIVSDPVRPATNITQCTSVQTNVFVIVSLTYSFLLLFLLIICAYSIRAAYSIFNEARSLAVASYTFVIPTVIITLIELTLSSENKDNIHQMFIIRSISILAAFHSSFGILLIRVITESISSNNVTTIGNNKSPYLVQPVRSVKATIDVRPIPKS